MIKHKAGCLITCYTTHKLKTPLSCKCKAHVWPARRRGGPDQGQWPGPPAAEIRRLLYRAAAWPPLRAWLGDSSNAGWARRVLTPHGAQAAKFSKLNSHRITTPSKALTMLALLGGQFICTWGCLSSAWLCTGIVYRETSYTTTSTP